MATKDRYWVVIRYDQKKQQTLTPCPREKLIAAPISKFEEKVLKFMEDSYHDETGNFKLPESLEMKKYISN